MPSPNPNQEFEDISLLISSDTADSIKIIAVQNNITFEECAALIIENGVLKMQSLAGKSLAEIFAEEMKSNITKF